jgi:hypothetical protein
MGSKTIILWVEPRVKANGVDERGKKSEPHGVRFRF